MGMCLLSSLKRQYLSRYGKVTNFMMDMYLQIASIG